MLRSTVVIAFVVICCCLFAGNGYSYTWQAYGGHQYALTATTSWESAQAEAVAAGGNLVTIGDAAEEAWLRTTFGTSYLWIGFTDKAVEGTWKWISGEPVTYTNWNGGEPNNYYGENYAVMNWSDVRWNDLSGTQGYPGIIEKSAVPLPPALLLFAPGLAGLAAVRRRFKR